jgi:hypothetical protein
MSPRTTCRRQSATFLTPNGEACPSRPRLAGSERFLAAAHLAASSARSSGQRRRHPSSSVQLHTLVFRTSSKHLDRECRLRVLRSQRIDSRLRRLATAKWEASRRACSLETRPDRLRVAEECPPSRAHFRTGSARTSAGKRRGAVAAAGHLLHVPGTDCRMRRLLTLRSLKADKVHRRIPGRFRSAQAPRISHRTPGCLDDPAGGQLVAAAARSILLAAGCTSQSHWHFLAGCDAAFPACSLRSACAPAAPCPAFLAHCEQ